MKIKDLDNIIDNILVEQTKKLIKEQAQEEIDGKKMLFNTIKGFQTLSGLVDKISNIEDISDEQHDVGITISVNNVSAEELMKCCGGSTPEEAQKNLMQGLHMDMEEKGLGSNMDIDVDVEGDESNMNLKINIKSAADAEQLGSDMSENTENMENQEPMEGNAFVDALNKAKEDGKDKFEVDGKEYNVEECWKQLEEEEMGEWEEETTEEEECQECGGSNMTEQAIGSEGFDDFDTQIQPEEMTDYSSLDDTQAYFDSVTGKGDEAQSEMTEGEGMCSECGSGLMSEGECMECGYKPMNESKLKSYKLSESKLVDMISKIVLESVPGLDAVKKSHSDANNTEYLNSVDKKLKDYLSFDGNDNPEFPKQIGKGEKMAVNNTEEENEFVEDNRGGGMQHLEYDNKPSPEFVERLKKALSGDSTMGNAQDKDVANVVPSDLGEKMAKQVERKHKKDIEAPMYKKDPAPTTEVKPSKKESVNESTVDNKVLDEIKKMKNMSSYNKKTQ